MPSDMLAHNRRLIEHFRTNGAPEGRPLLLLTTTGRRSGERRTSPMMYIRDGDRLLVVASNAGADRDPMWYLNLVSDPRVHVEIGTESYEATAVPLEGDDRAEAFARIVAGYPFFADHQAKVRRQIPVVELVPA
ncbi:MAG TPA: nitroreductase family deazaflavin-dependent oxidoreductase [Micromonosporaceae bacterium]|nr:nitroreductase family deazaflavin-dependent oxidoreductase [Micromonosporaceae bacterium]